MDVKQSILGNTRTLRETCIMSLIVSKEPQGKKRRKTHEYGEVS